MFKKIVLFCFLLSSFCCQSQAQTDIWEEEKFKFQVKQFDEWLQRFNYQKTIEGKNPPKYDIIERQRYILSLFDKNYLKEADKDRKNRVLSFAKEISEKNIVLNFYDSAWFALSETQVLYEQQEKILKICLMNEEIAPKTSSWVLVGADYLQYPTPYRQEKYISPSSHERNFMEIKHLDKNFAKSYFPKDFQVDALSQVHDALASGKLSFQHSQHLSFHLLQIEGWIVEIQYFNRADHNSGWLISQLIQCDTPTKQRYLREKLLISKLLKINLK